MKCLHPPNKWPHMLYIGTSQARIGLLSQRLKDAALFQIVLGYHAKDRRASHLRLGLGKTKDPYEIDSTSITSNPGREPNTYFLVGTIPPVSSLGDRVRLLSDVRSVGRSTRYGGLNRKHVRFVYPPNVLSESFLASFSCSPEDSPTKPDVDLASPSSSHMPLRNVLFSRRSNCPVRFFCPWGGPRSLLSVLPRFCRDW